MQQPSRSTRAQRPVLAFLVRALVFLLPAIVAWVVVSTISHLLWRPGGSVGVVLWAMQLALLVMGTVVVVERAARRIPPLAGDTTIAVAAPGSGVTKNLASAFLICLAAIAQSAPADEGLTLSLRRGSPVVEQQQPVPESEPQDASSVPGPPGTIVSSGGPTTSAPPSTITTSDTIVPPGGPSIALPQGAPPTPHTTAPSNTTVPQSTPGTNPTVPPNTTSPPATTLPPVTSPPTTTTTSPPPTTTMAPAASDPIARADAAIVALGSSTTINVLANDTDPDGDLDPSSLTIASPPSKGSATVSGNRIVYTLGSGEVLLGRTSLTYEVCDSGNRCDTGTVTITIVLA